MAIEIIGTPQTSNTNNGGTTTCTFDTTPSEGDYTVAIIGSPADGAAIGTISTSGYTELKSHAGAAAANPSLAIWYKKQGSSPDSNVQGTSGNGSTTDSSMIAFVLRGVDATTFSDATPTTAGETSSTNPDPASIAGASANFCTIVLACMTVVKDTSVTAPSGYTGYSVVGDDTYDHTLAAAYKLNCNGTEAPASWTNWDSGLWYAITVAVKPAVEPPKTINTGDTATEPDVTVTENIEIKSGPQYIPSVYDEGFVSENITTQAGPYYIDVYDEAFVSEDITSIVPSGTASIYDSINVSEQDPPTVTVVTPGTDITLDGTVQVSNNTTTKAVTVADNSNRLMLVSFATYQGGGPSSVKWNGTDLTKIEEQVGSYNEQCSIWGLVAPEPGSYNVVVAGVSSWYCFGVYSLYNCSQTLPHNTNKNGGESGTASVSLTTGHDNSWVVACIEAEAALTMTTSGGTEDFNEEGASYQHGEGQHILKASVGSQTMSADLGYGSRWNEVVIEVEVAGEAASYDIDVYDEAFVSENVSGETVDNELNINIDQWYNASWGYRQKLTINASQVEADATDFPVYIRLGDLDSTFHTNVNQTDARDIRVTKADGVTELPREVVSYNSATDAGELYFKYEGTLSGSDDTEIYIYYGNAGASDYADNDTYGAENVWNSSYEAVYHLSETTGSAEDSTSNAHDGTYNGSVPNRSTGHQAGTYSQYFDGDHDRIAVARHDDFEGTQVTMSAWFKRDGNQNADLYPKIVSYGPPDPSPYGSYVLGINGDNVSINEHFASDSTGYDITPTFTSTDATWYYVVGTHSGTAQTFRVNGASIATASNTFTLGNFTGDGLGIGCTYAYEGAGPGFNDYTIKGYISEVRISTTARPTTWTDTEYNNMSAPTTFYTTGVVETSGETLITVSEDIQIEVVEDLNISDVYDEVFVSEYLNATRNYHEINTFEEIEVSELEPPTVTEIGGTKFINVYDEVFVSENLTSKVPTEFINIYDEGFVSENINATRNYHEINVYDETFISEDVNATRNYHEVNVYDEIFISELDPPNLSVGEPSNYQVDVSDEAYVSEYINATRNYHEISVYDSVEVSELDPPTVTEVSPDTVFISDIYDEGFVSENVTVQQKQYIINVYDSLNASESTTVLEKNLIINTYDSITASENISGSAIGGNAVIFSTTSHYGILSAYTALGALTNYTIEGWFNQSASGSPYSQVWVVQESDGSPFAIRLGTENATPSEGANFSTILSTQEADGYTTDTVFDVGNWTHVAEVFSTSDNKTRIYVNGTEVSYNLQNTGSGTQQSPSGMNFYLGRNALQDYPNFYGQVGGFIRIWNVARTQTQINTEKSLLLDPTRETGLIANFNFTEGAGSTLDNTASAGNDMALGGSPLWTSGPTTTEKGYIDINVYDSVEVSESLTTDQIFIVDSYDYSNQDDFVQLAISITGQGHSFTGDGRTLTGAVYYMFKEGSPTGNIVCKIYEHSGTYGTSSVPTGTALATSEVIDVSTIPIFYYLTTFQFTGANQITLENGTNYVVTVEYSNGDGSNYIGVGADETSPTHGGNDSYYSDSTWTAFPSWDVVFYILGKGATSIQSINKYENINISENLDAKESYCEINISENITISEAVTSSPNVEFINIYDSITVEDYKSVDTGGDKQINVYDGIVISDEVGELYEEITISEEETEELPFGLINVYEAISISEGLTVRVPLITINVSDSITISESSSVFRPSSEPYYNINITENISVEESTTAATNFLRLSIYDSISIQDVSVYGTFIHGWYYQSEPYQGWTDTSDVSSAWTDTADSQTTWN